MINKTINSILLLALSLMILFLAHGCGDVSNKIVGRAVSDDVVKIGVITGLTGETVQVGEYAVRGANAALNRINSDGGVNGLKVKLIFEDSQYLPRYSLDAANKLVEHDKVDGIVISSGASSALAILPYVNEKKVILVEAICVVPACHTKEDYLFRVSGKAEDQARFLSNYIRNKTNYTRIGVLWVNNDYGLYQKQAFMEYYDGEVLFDESYEQGDADFRSQLTKAASADVDALMLFTYTETGYILKQAGELGLDIALIGTIASQVPDTIRVAGEYAEGFRYSHFSQPREYAEAKEFYETYVEKYHDQPQIFSTKVYDALMVLVEAMRHCPPHDTECTVSEMYKIKDFPGVSNMITLDDHGDLAEEKFEMKIIRNGSFERLSE